MENYLNIGIFGGCNSTPLSDDLKNKLVEIAQSLPTNNVKVVYGGGFTGVMHVIPQKFNSMGGKVKTINSHSLMKAEDYDKFYGELKIYDTLDIRQSKLIESSDIFLCLPGGIGTYSELFQIMALNHVKARDCAVLIYNYNNYFDSLKTLIDNLPKSPENLTFYNNTNDIILALNDHIKKLKN
ncbi:putative lysine decarboxylase [Catovirus CTV1]|uniref:Putative lysine decarboxylase n=1 Tax=Catovirus CTV1 TaxID=1977631 RepID=A0A1V0S9E9_9VIRU|nr:putative lysine decarboxylase [Catovirus CTV1]